jgi:hypothetical protein
VRFATLFAAAVVIFAFAIPLFIPAMASVELEPRAVIEDEGNNPSLNSTGSGTEAPLLEKVSDNGTYLVQLAWPTLPLNPDDAFDLQVFFLNASNPRGTNGTAAQPETNFTGSGIEAGGTDPETMMNIIDVESYDITIYSDDGSVLWQKMDQPGVGGSAGERIIIANNYTGPVTIEITDIRPGSETVAASAGSTDSVSFTATIVPEFPLAVIPLVSSIAVVLFVLRTRFARAL